MVSLFIPLWYNFFWNIQSTIFFFLHTLINFLPILKFVLNIAKNHRVLNCLVVL